MADNTVLLLPHQELFLQSPNSFKDIRWHFLLAGYGAGKATPVSTLIPTPTGYRRFGDLKVGDYVFSADGKPTKVQKIFPQGMKDAYKVTLSDGRSAVCCKEHLWGVYYHSHSDYKYKVMELSEMLEKGIRRPDQRYTKAGGKPKFWLPASPVCEYPEKKLPVDPYVLGALIGNGCLTAPYLTISSNDEWQVAKTAERLGLTYKKNNSNYSWLFYKGEHYVRTDSIVPEQLCCLAGNKFIPEEYFTSSVEQRKELLQGLFDADGSVDNSGNRLHVTYSTTSKKLAEDIRTLLLSLGIVSTIRLDNREGKNTCYALSVNCAQEQKAWLFSLPRKLERITSFKRADKRDYSRVAIHSIEKLPQQMEMQCIMVEDEKHLYLTEEHIVTHNTRSLAIAALHIIAELDGEKDDGGLYAKIAVAGYTYAHLEQTFLIDFKAYLDASKTPYHEDTKDHIITVGTVQVMFLQLSDPGKIFGQSIYCALADEIDELEEDTMIEAMKSLSQRVRQIMPGHRSPYIMAASTAQGMKGFYRLYSHYKKSGVGFVLTRARTQDNWYLPKEYIEDLWKNFTETERRVYMEGEFLTVTQGRVIPGFDWDKNYDGRSDMDLELVPGERVYIGMDFNCLVGDTLILTSRGNVPIKDVKVGDYVLTRKGYRKVLTSVSRGVKIVYDFNRLTGTKDHVAITPQGDVELCRAQNFYCLTEQSIKELQQLSRVQENLNALKQFYTMDTYGDAGLTVLTTTLETILRATEHSCISASIKSSMVKCLRASKSITKTAVMTTDLKVLYACLPQLIQSCIREAVLATSAKKHGNIPQIRLWSGISLRTVKSITRKLLKAHGVEESSAVLYAASIVARILRLASERLNAARYAGKNIPKSLKKQAIEEAVKAVQQSVTLELRGFVLSAEKLLSEQLQRSIAKNIKVIGSAPVTNEREAEVFDIEVEGEHEFFANGILVHNCSYNRASAWVSREGRMHCVKYYDFPDSGESAKVFRYDFPYQDIFWLPDVTSKDLYPQYARELRKYGIHIIHRTKSPLVEDSCFLLSKMCLQGRLIIHSQASEVADAFATASRDKNNKIPKGVGPSSPIHAIDGARYACSYMALVLPEYRDVRDGLMQHLASFRRSLEEPDGTVPVRYKGAGYTQIEGEAFL